MLTIQIIDGNTVSINGIRYACEAFDTYGSGPTALAEPDLYHQLVCRKDGVLTIRVERNLVDRVIMAYRKGCAAALRNDAKNPYVAEEAACHRAWATGASHDVKHL